MPADGAELDAWVNDVHCGDVRETLAAMPADSVHMCMTSPPYFGLRDYGADGQIGLEDSLDEYIAELVAVGDELRRVLRDDGSWWLNLGDTYDGNSIVRSDAEWTAPGEDGYDELHVADEREAAGNTRRSTSRLGRKNKMLVPHRTAIALQEAGWVVRNDVTWVKPNPMPQSVKDRLNTTTEQIFHLTPKPDYWYDLDAIREPRADSTVRDAERGYGWNDNKVDPNGVGHHSEGGVNDPDSSRDEFLHPSGKNPGDVFEVTTKSFPDAHFAVYPPELCETPIEASCPPRVCAECGTGYERITERHVELEDGLNTVGLGEKTGDEQTNDTLPDQGRHGSDSSTLHHTVTREHQGWVQACDCATDATEPGIVIDPFAGAGTTCLVAKRLGRRFVGIDLNDEYVAMAQGRIGIPVDNPSVLADDGQATIDELFDDAGQHSAADSSGGDD